jgi:death-on-curing protein
VTAYLSLEDLLELCKALGGLQVRDVGLLDSAAHRPTSVLFGAEVYPDLDTKAAVLLESIVRHRPLRDNNERLGWVAVVVFYWLNDRDVDAPDDPVYDLVIAVAEGRLAYPEIATALGSWTRSTDQDP